MINRVNFSIVPFPSVQWSGDIFQLAQLLADHLQGNLDQSAFSGQFGGTEPLTNVGLWFDSDVWKYWHNALAKYIPIGVVAGLTTDGVTHTARLAATNTEEDIILFLPPEGGNLARIQDLDVGSETMTEAPAGNAIGINWQNANIYSIISGNATVTDPGGGLDAKRVDLWVETPPGHASPLTITFPATWRKSDISLGTTDATHRTVDHFVINRLGTDTFVYRIGRFSIDQAGVDGDTSAPVFVSANIKTDTAVLKVIFNELIQGTTPTSAWLVQKNGITQGISAANIINTRVNLYLDNPVTLGSSDDVLTVQYLGGGTVKDLAGNAASAFGLTGAEIKV